MSGEVGEVGKRDGDAEDRSEVESGRRVFGEGLGFIVGSWSVVGIGWRSGRSFRLEGFESSLRGVREVVFFLIAGFWVFDGCGVGVVVGLRVLAIAIDVIGFVDAGGSNDDEAGQVSMSCDGYRWNKNKLGKMR